MNEMKQRILDTMYYLIAEKGYDKTSTNLVCDEVGVTKPTLYYYFKNKEALLLELISCYGSSFVEEMSGFDSLSNRQSFQKQFLAWGEGFVANLVEDEPFHRVVAEINLLVGRLPQVKQALEPFAQRRQETIQATVEQGQAMGALTSRVPAATLTQIILTFLDGLKSQVNQNPNGAYQAAWSAFVQGLFQ